MNEPVERGAINPIDPVDEFCERLRRALNFGQAESGGSSSLPPECLRMLDDLAAIQRFAKSLSDGDLTSELHVKGRLAGSLKALQANLRHLTWQVQQVAAGDLSQKVDFMGDFSAAFNLMIDRLEQSQRIEREMRQQSDAMREAAADLNRALSQEEVLDSMITFAPNLVGGEALDVLLIDDQVMRIHRAAGRERDTAEELEALEAVPVDLNALALLLKAAQTRQPEMAANAAGAALPGYPAADWARSAMAITVPSEGQVVGFMCALSADPGGLTQLQAERLAVYANQAGVSISKARLVDALAWYASTDALTGVPNRRSFFQRAEQELDRSIRYKRKFSIAMLDIDHFKTINDEYGHAAGDQALAAVAAVCVEKLRASDTIGRMGGEEFAALLPETEGYPAYAIAERLRRAIAEHEFVVDGRSLHITVSVGVAVWDGGGESFQQTLTKADRAMYSAKHAGRNCTILYTPGVTR